MNNLKTYYVFVNEMVNAEAPRTAYRREMIRKMLSDQWIDTTIRIISNRFGDSNLLVSFSLRKLVTGGWSTDTRLLYIEHILQLKIEDDNTLNFSKDQYLNGYWYKLNFKKEESGPLMIKVLETIDEEIKKDPTIVKHWTKIPEPFNSRYPELSTGKELGLL